MTSPGRGSLRRDHYERLYAFQLVGDEMRRPAWSWSGTASAAERRRAAAIAPVLTVPER